MKINCIAFRSDLSVEYFFHAGILLISDTLSTERKLEIIEKILRED